MKKVKIYYLLGTQANLQPISGDRINEINIIKALSKYYDVYYNGELCCETDQTFGRSDGIITPPKKGLYDLVYVRNNKDVFMAAPPPKLWFSSPYDSECFDAADGIACMTAPWRDRLSNYSSTDFEYFRQMYPKNMATPKCCLLFPQVVHLPSDATLSEIQTNNRAPRKNQGLLKHLLGIKKSNPALNLQHFGPIRPSNFPHQLAHLLTTGHKLANNITAECIGPGNKMTIPAPIKTTPRVDPQEAFSRLVNADAIWYNQDQSGNFAGSLKVLEAMTVGVPLLLPKYDARAAELGQDYPFFWELIGDDITNVNQPFFIKSLENLLDLTDHERKQLSGYLRDRADAHSYETIAPILRDEIDKFMTQY